MMKTSPRPKANPARKKPMKNPMNDMMSPKSIEDRSTREMKKGGKVAKMAMGGTCRGMGAATKGGKYSKAG